MKNSLLSLLTLLVLSAALCLMAADCKAQPELNVLVITERGGLHEGFASAALDWMNKLAEEKNFKIKVINNTSGIDEPFLSDFNLIVQLDYPPYAWEERAVKAFEDYIEKGKGGWVGFHHATLLGEFDGYPMWNWFSGFMGGIRFENYVAGKVEGTVRVEDKRHPVMAGVASSFVVTDEEWYTFNKSPRPDVHVLADVDESSYKPASDIRMGDHPVIWINEKMKARNVYFLMGHDGSLFKNDAFTTMFRNAIFWAGGIQKLICSVYLVMALYCPSNE